MTGKLAESEGLVVSLRAQLAVAETSKVHAETVAKVTAERDMFQRLQDAQQRGYQQALDTVRMLQGSGRGPPPSAIFGDFSGSS